MARRGGAGPVDQPQDDEMEIHEALINWAMWCRVRWHQGHAGSAEGRYVDRAGRVYLRGGGGRVRVNMLLGDKVNTALLAVAPQHRHALQLRYHMRMTDSLICRLLSLRPAAYGRFLRDARLMLGAALQAVGKTVTVPPHVPPTT